MSLYRTSLPSSIASINTRLPSREEFDILRDPRYKGNLGAICSGKMLRITGTFLTSCFNVWEDDKDVSCAAILSSDCGTSLEIAAKLDIRTTSAALAIAYLDDTEILEVKPL